MKTTLEYIVILLEVNIIESHKSLSITSDMVMGGAVLRIRSGLKSILKVTIHEYGQAGSLSLKAIIEPIGGAINVMEFDADEIPCSFFDSIETICKEFLYGT